MDNQHLKGHLNMSVIEDTFLVDAEQKFPDSSIKINCLPHNAPAVFFSRMQNAYKCFKCLVSEQDLIYIDKRFKKEMEDFETIKETTAKSVRDNTSNATLIRDWKRAMRRTLLDVRQQFVDWIDSFTNKFVKSLAKIECSKELADFQHEDSKLERELAEIKEKYVEILKIFQSVARAEAVDKLVCIES